MSKVENTCENMERMVNIAKILDRQFEDRPEKVSQEDRKAWICHWYAQEWILPLWEDTSTGDMIDMILSGFDPLDYMTVLRYLVEGEYDLYETVDTINSFRRFLSLEEI